MDRGATENPGQLELFDELHPQAASALRHAALAGRLVPYRFERRRRRTIGITVDERGLAVAAPLRAPWREIARFLEEKARWIVARLDEWATAGRPPPLHGASGERLPLFGSDLVLEVSEGPLAVQRDAGRLRLVLPEPHRRGAVRALLVAWLKPLALAALAPRAAHFAARVGLVAPPIALSNARTQWGVCMESGRIRLSWRLVHLDPALADYVVAHEVAHLVELNHSRRFWAVVEKLYPDWRAARRRIGLAAATIPNL